MSTHAPSLCWIVISVCIRSDPAPGLWKGPGCSYINTILKRCLRSLGPCHIYRVPFGLVTSSGHSKVRRGSVCLSFAVGCKFFRHSAYSFLLRYYPSWECHFNRGNDWMISAAFQSQKTSNSSQCEKFFPLYLPSPRAITLKWAWLCFRCFYKPVFWGSFSFVPWRNSDKKGRKASFISLRMYQCVYLPNCLCKNKIHPHFLLYENSLLDKLKIQIWIKHYIIYTWS